MQAMSLLFLENVCSLGKFDSYEVILDILWINLMQIYNNQIESGIEWLKVLKARCPSRWWRLFFLPSRLHMNTYSRPRTAPALIQRLRQMRKKWSMNLTVNFWIENFSFFLEAFSVIVTDQHDQVSHTSYRHLWISQNRSRKFKLRFWLSWCVSYRYCQWTVIWAFERLIREIRWPAANPQWQKQSTEFIFIIEISRKMK